MEENIILSALDKIYGAIVDGTLPGLDSAEELANSYMSENGSPLSAAESLVRWQNAKSATSGFVTGLGGLITLPVTLPANVTSVLYVQVRMIAAIAHIGGQDLKDDRVKTLVYACLTGSTVVESIKSVGIPVANCVGTALVRQIPKELIGKINKAIGARLVTRFGTKGIINLGKAVPLLGGLLSGSLDAIATNTVGNVAIRAFIDENY